MQQNTQALKVKRTPEKPRGFDLQVQVRDETGAVVEENHYLIHAVGGSRYFERPVGSGNLFYENGDTAGRFIKGKVELDLSHVAYEAPLTGDAKIAAEMEMLRRDNESVKAELAAIKAEKARTAGEKQTKEIQGDAKPGTTSKQGV